MNWAERRRAAREIAQSVEQHEDEDMNCVLAAGFIHAALASAKRVDGEPMGIEVEPVMVEGVATSVIRGAGLPEVRVFPGGHTREGAGRCGFGSMS
jgi:hypothetical protein